MRIAIDFDDTIVYEQYPNIGDLIPGAKEVINWMYYRGHIIIINTCRAEDEAYLAQEFLDKSGIKYTFFNENDPALIRKYGKDTRKISCDLNIDDKNVYYQHALAVRGTQFRDEFWSDFKHIFTVLERPLIIAVIGESGVGKSMVAKHLESRYGINLIESYTDRTRRTHDETGHTFLEVEEMDKIFNSKDVLAKTIFGGYRYCCLIYDLWSINTYVIDENGYNQLVKDWGDTYDIISLRIKRDLIYRRKDGVSLDRIERDLDQFTMEDQEFDYIIQNDGTKEDLLHEIAKTLIKAKLHKRFNYYEL